MRTKEIDDFLMRTSISDKVQIKYRLDIADKALTLCRRYKVTEERFMEEMGLTPLGTTEFLKGAKDYSIRDLAKLEALDNKLYGENNDIIKIPLDEKKDEKKL